MWILRLNQLIIQLRVLEKRHNFDSFKFSRTLCVFDIRIAIAFSHGTDEQMEVFTVAREKLSESVHVNVYVQVGDGYPNTTISVQSYTQQTIEQLKIE